jgi:hypothetical protein
MSGMLINFFLKSAKNIATCRICEARNFLGMALVHSRVTCITFVHTGHRVCMRVGYRVWGRYILRGSVQFYTILMTTPILTGRKEAGKSVPLVYPSDTLCSLNIVGRKEYPTLWLSDRSISKIMDLNLTNQITVFVTSSYILTVNLDWLSHVLTKFQIFFSK